MSDFWIGTSFKMNKTLAEALAFAEALAAGDESRDQRFQRFVIPPFTAVREVKAALKDTSVKVGAQNMHWDDAGAWTGDTAADAEGLQSRSGRAWTFRAPRVLVKRTERLASRFRGRPVRHGLTPLICIGESLAQREAGEADAVLAAQVQAALALLEGEAKRHPILLAYEPIWAIGVNGIPATSDYADERHRENCSYSQVGARHCRTCPLWR